MAIAATDAGADSAVQPGSAASSEAGAAFQILMTAAGEPVADPSAPAAVPTLPQVQVSTDEAPLAGATQMLASDLEQMVQALAITAEVVAQGMAARTTPVREIILTVETPTTENPEPQDLTQLAILAPAPVETGPSLKISDADPAKNLDPALIALMPQNPQIASSKAKMEEMAVIDTNLDSPHAIPVAEIGPVAEMPLPQMPFTPVEEPYGPWRAEVHGPVLNAQSELITQPVHIALFDAPIPSNPIMKIAQPQNEPAQQPDIQSEMTMVPLNDSPVIPGPMLTDEPLRVVTIHVPVTAKTAPEHEEKILAESNDRTSESEPLELPATENLQPALANHMPADFIGPQLMTIVASQIQRETVPAADVETFADALNAPRPAPTEAKIVFVAAAPTEATRPPNPGAGAATQTPAFDVAALVETLHRDADIARAVHRQALDAHKYESLLEINITNSVAKTSSRSSNDIRDLKKLGIRDIEIIQSTGSAQTMNASPQAQTTELTSTSATDRADFAPAFVSTGKEANAADRRAQAHEIRMRAIERQVVAAVRDGADTIRMQLYPPGLGQIIIRLTMDGSKLKLATSANSSDAADSLRSIEGDLREALSVGGLELTGFDVSEDGDGGQKNRKDKPDTDNNIQHSRSAKSDDFALDMNA